MLEGLTPAHLLFVLVIALLVVGPGKLPEVGAALGKTIRGFRDAASGSDDASPDVAPASPTATPPAPPPAG